MSKGSIPEKGCIFGTSTGRCFLRGQSSMSYDSESCFRGTRSTSATCFHFRGSLAENAGFRSPDLQF